MSNKNAVWRIVEQQVADALGFKRIAFSGGIWPNKEDAEDLDFICQMKATEGRGITVKIDDIDQITKRGLIQHKKPLFVFHMENAKYDLGKTWVAMPLQDFKQIKEEYYNEQR